MSNLLELVNELRGNGVHLAVDGDKLQYRAPKGVLTDELKQRLANQKAEIIRLLQSEIYREGPPYPDGLGRVKCVYCERLDSQYTCKVSKQRMSGIALLITCSDFTMTTVH